MAPAVPPPLHDLEAEIMDVLWTRDEATVRAVMDELNERAPKPRAYTTYMTTLARLDRKGLLTRRREGKTDHYRATLSRAQYAEARAAAQVEALVDEYGDVALTHFARQVARLDPERLEALQRLARGG
jgi:predicted transcriptional regulator